MSDRLDLPWEPPEDEPATPADPLAAAWSVRRRALRARFLLKPDPAGPKSGRSAIALLGAAFRPRPGRGLIAAGVALALLVALAVAGVAGVSFLRGLRSAPDYASDRGSELVVVQVRPGQTAADIGTVLQAAGVVRSEAAFVNAADGDPDSRLIQVGYYQLPRGISAHAALGRLLARSPDGQLVNKVSHQITIPEGMITVDIYQKLADFTGRPVAEFRAAAADPVKLGLPAWWLTRDDGKKPLTPPSIEGFLYPDTYDIPPGASAADILGLMVDRFLTVTGDLGFAGKVQSTLHITPYEALVAASIAQVEAVYPADMAGVARVLYNRAFDANFPCRCLGLDSEVNYWLRVSGQKAQPSGELRDRQLHDPKDPYNTHDRPGLPVGPISNPGLDALKGAMTPPRTDDLYFLGIDTAGHVAFAHGYADFCRLVHKAAANGVSIGSCRP